MTFWFITAAMAALVVLVLARALMRGAEEDVADAAEFDLKVYRDQLQEVERDVARGVVSSQDAERTLTEISRRILSADKARQDGARAGAAPSPLVPGGLALAVVVGAFALYLHLGQPGYGDLALNERIATSEEMRANRPSQQKAEDSLPPDLPKPELTPRYAALLTQLRAAVSTRPDDLEGHELLTQYEAKAGNFIEAARAQETVLRIKGPEATVADAGDYAELLVLAAGGYVSPEAEAVLRAIIEQDDQNPRARYYIGLMMLQTGRPDVAFRLWDGLLRRGPEDAPWIAPISAQIMQVAALAGVNYAMPQIGSGAGNGPTAEDIEAASDMSAQDRMEMIGGMVDGLSARLASEGGPPEDWARLITSLGVLGRTDQARAIFDNAMEVFAGIPAAEDLIRRAGSQAGVAE